jgi:hypothetical protein
MLGWRIRDALLDRLVLRPHQHFVLLGTVFNFGTTGCGRCFTAALAGWSTVSANDWPIERLRAPVVTSILNMLIPPKLR